MWEIEAKLTEVFPDHARRLRCKAAEVGRDGGEELLGLERKGKAVNLLSPLRTHFFFLCLGKRRADRGSGKIRIRPDEPPRRKVGTGLLPVGIVLRRRCCCCCWGAAAVVVQAPVAGTAGAPVVVR